MDPPMQSQIKMVVSPYPRPAENPEKDSLTPPLQLILESMFVLPLLFAVGAFEALYFLPHCLSQAQIHMGLVGVGLQTPFEPYVQASYELTAISLAILFFNRIKRHRQVVEMSVTVPSVLFIVGPLIVNIYFAASSPYALYNRNSVIGYGIVLFGSYFVLVFLIRALQVLIIDRLTSKFGRRPIDQSSVSKLP
jgi:hypothetical protein